MAEAAQNNGHAQQQQAPGFQQMCAGIVRMMVMWWIMKSIMGSLFGGNTPAVDPSTTGAAASVQSLVNAFRDNERFHMDVYTSPSKNYSDGSLLWSERGLRYNFDESNHRAKNFTIDVDEHLIANGSLYIHVVVTRDASAPSDVLTYQPPPFDLTTWVKVPKNKATRNLLEAETEDGSPPSVHIPVEFTEGVEYDDNDEFLDNEYAVGEDSDEEEPQAPDFAASMTDLFATLDVQGSMMKDIGYKSLQAEVERVGDDMHSIWCPKLTLSFIVDRSKFSRASAPPTISPFLLSVENPENYGLAASSSLGYYYPIIYYNDFWTFQEHRIPLNDTLRGQELPLEIEIDSLSLMKWQLQVQMEQSFKMQESMGSIAENEKDELKRMFVETNPWLLGITFVVSILHMVFDFLAFKNDIKFWKENKSMEGLSLRTILFNSGTSFVIFLYLLDNDTSWMILISSGIGCLIEAWKITKAVDVSVDGYRIRFKTRDSYSQSKTREYDEMAMKYLGYLLYPIVIGTSIYSLIYDTHRSWYSWVLSSMVGAIYTFGFIMMTPQLFINYRLKSVAHMPWRVMVYKALNTFIDDLFAFIIKMPTLHRLSCFRDDIIFFIFLYQRWKYPVDKSRANEYGQVHEERVENAETADGDSPATSDDNADATAASSGDTAAEETGETESKKDQ